jgi:hypothetical protein
MNWANNLSRLFIVLSFLCVHFSYALAGDINECKTDIWFGNGVWNDRNDAEENRDELEILVLDAIYQDNQNKMYQKHDFKLAYNWGQGAMTDVLETYYQLKQMGQVSDSTGFFTLLALFHGDLLDATAAAALYEVYEPMIQDWEAGNVEQMWRDYYYPHSFKLGHRVLLVSHSQGNLFAHRIYEKMSPNEYKNYFRNLAVATPAGSVPGEGGVHVTFSFPLSKWECIYKPGMKETPDGRKLV